MEEKAARLTGTVSTRRASRWRQLALLLAVIGPGFITANVDNDAGGIFTYSLAGAQFGYSLLWTMIPITIALIVVQEMAARMGAVTGKGLSDLIREEFGFRLTFCLMLALVVTNFGNVVAEFAGVASSLELFGCSKYIVVPVAAVVVWLLVVRGTYDSSREDLPRGVARSTSCYIVAGFWRTRTGRRRRSRRCRDPSRDRPSNYGYLFMVIGLVGTTIAPWMQFYLQASIVEKGITRGQYRASRWDVILGCIFTDVVAWFIIVACAATLFAHGHHDITDAADAAQALRPLAGQYAYLLFAAGLFNASLFAASILPISTVYAVCEGLRLRVRPRQEVSRGAGLLLALHRADRARRGRRAAVPRLPAHPRHGRSRRSPTASCCRSCSSSCCCSTNDRELMGDHVNSRGFNTVAWITTVVMIVLTLLLVANGFGLKIGA